MFDISWSELLIVAVVAIIFVGPKELPAFVRTIGRYVGMLKRQANDFRKSFEDAMREAELDTMREEVEAMQRSINEDVMSGKRAILEAESEARRAFEAPVLSPSSPAVPANQSSAAVEQGSNGASASLGSAVQPPRPMPPAGPAEKVR